MKKCYKCGIEKELSEFNKDRTRKDGLDSRCKVCKKQYRLENKEYFSQKSLEYHRANREHCLVLRRKNRQKPENKLKAREYYKENKKHIYERNERWRKNNPDKVKIIAKRWNISAKGKLVNKNFRGRHKEEIAGYMREYRQRPEPREEAMLRNLNRHYLKKTSGEKITREQICELLVQQDNKCFYCDKDLKKYHQDHIVPLNCGGEHRINNIVLSCPACNCSKKDMDPEDFVNKILEAVV